MTMVTPILWILIVPLALTMLGALLRLAIFLGRRRRNPRQREPDVARCDCGYELTNLDRIRCPECGKVFGFNATAEELGLSDDELRRATEARERRRAAPSQDTRIGK